MRKLLLTASFLVGLAGAQTIPTPLLVSRVNNITSAAQVQDNRSQAARYCDYHSFLASGTGTWSVTMEYSDSSVNGPWSSFGSAAVITNADNPPIGYGFGYHPFIRFETTVGSTSVNYTCQSSLYIPPGGNGGGGVTFPITIQEGGTSATTATGATVNLQYLSPYTGAVAESDATALNRQVSVWEFGTPGTTSDWTTPFQNAINVYTQRGGVQVYIPCGTYNFANSISVTHQPVSIVGESEHCVVLNYTGTGTFLSVVDTPPTGGPHGEYRNFTIATPNATSSTIAMEVATNHGLFENLQATSCAAGTGFQIDNGLVNSGTGAPWYGEFNSWINVSDDHCHIGYRHTPSGGSPPDPTQSFMNYNYFENISGLASSGQTVFQVDPGFYFSHNYIDLSCKIDNQSTISSTLPSICIKSSGNWFQNTTYLNGEWNSTVGTSTGPPYSVQILSGGKFTNVGGGVNVFAIPGNGGAPVAVDNEAGNGDGTPFATVHQQYQPDWDTGTYTLGSTSTTPWTGFRDQGTGSLGVLEGTSVNSPFVTMNSTTGNKFIVGKVTPGSVFGTMTDVADVDTSGNLTLKGTNINVNGLSWTWPSSHSSGCLNDNGSGTISIVSCSGSGGSGLSAPGTNNVLVYYTSGLSTAPATASNVLTTLSSALGAPNGLATLDSSALLPLTQVPPSVVQSTNSYANPSWITTLDSGKLVNTIPSALIPASSAGNFGGLKDNTCTSGQHIFSIIAGIITCTADSGGGGGAPAISALLGATSANTISNGDNAQVWNWTIGTTNKTGLTISESSPSTAAGTPILFRSSTLSTSTAYPVFFSAQGTANGVYMPPTGILQKIPGGTGGIDAGSLLNTVPIGTLPVIGLQTFAEAGGCANGIPYAVFDLPSSAYPTPNCYGTSYPFGALDFLDAANSYSYLRMVVPSGIQTEDVDVYWFSGSATQTVNFTVATSCIPAGSGVISPTFNTAQTLTSTSGSANTLTVVTQTGVTLTGCAANDEELLQIGRDVSDSSTTTASLRGVRITVHENVSQ